MQDNVGIQLQDIAWLRERAIALQDAVSVLRSDIELKRRGYHFNWAIDFSEVYRYIHPYYDVHYQAGEDRLFILDQAFLHHLFEEKPVSLFLLRAYAEEYRDYLARLVKILSRITTDQAERFVGPELLTHKKFEKLRELVEREADTLDDEARKRFKEVFLGKRLIGLIGSDALQNFIEKNSAEKLNRILDEHGPVKWFGADPAGFVVPPVALRHPRSEGDALDAAPETNYAPLYEEVLSRINRARPSPASLQNNKTDAWATVALLALNRENQGTRNLFVLISSAHRYKHVVDALRIPGQPPEELREFTIQRDLTYYRLWMTFEKLGATHADQQLAEVESLCKQYNRLVERFWRRMEDNDPLVKTDRRYKELEGTFGQLFTLHRQLEAVPFAGSEHSVALLEKRLKEVGIRDIERLADDIKKVTKDPDELRRRLGRAQDRISKALARVEQAIADAEDGS